MREIAIGLALLVLGIVEPPSLRAQDNTQSSAPVQKAGASKTFTGCIVRGEGVDRYKFVAKDGTIWDAVTTTKSLKMNPYVARTVTVRGSLTPNPNDAKVGQNAGTIKRDLSKNNAGMVNIARVIKVGKACTQ